MEEAEKYQTYILIHLGKQYHRLGIAMQISFLMNVITIVGNAVCILSLIHISRSSTDPHGGSMTTRSAWKSR